VHRLEQTKIAAYTAGGAAEAHQPSGSLSPPSEKTEYHIKEKLQALRNVKVS